MRKDAEAAFLDRPRDALELYRRATALAPSHSALAWLRLARLHRQFKDPSSARAALRRGTRHLPKDARLWRALAQACKAAGDIEGARNHYGVVTKLDPDFVAGWDAWSRLELREGNPTKAAQLAKQGLSKVGALDAETPPPQSERLWHAYALALAAGGGGSSIDPDQAAEAILRKAVGIHPEHSHLRHALGVQLYKKGDTDQARKELRRAAIKGHDEALLSIARLEEEAGRVEEARTAYKRACGLIKRSPGTHEMAPDGVTAAPWVAWARFEEDCGNVEAAAALCRRASVRFPRDADVHAQWARLEVDQDRAREIIFAGLERCPHAIAASSNLLDGVEAHDMISAQVSRAV
jgi:tetratricopeptide (TPR) repeat protein